MAENGIQTVLGMIDRSNAGYIQPHEHLIIDSGNASMINPSLCIDDIDKSIKEVQTYKENGGCTIVDAQPLGAGRNAVGLVRIAQETGVHIIASTGFHKSMFYWLEHWIHTISSDKLYQFFIQELTDSMYLGNQILFPTKQVDARAGIIKTAVDSDGLSEWYLPKLEVAVSVSKETGVPVMVHIEKGSDPFEVITLLTRFGIPTDNIILCHLDRTHYDVQIHKEIAQAGVFLEYDTIGRFKYHDDNQEADLIIKMIEDGFTDSILLSLDTTRARLLSYNGEIGLTYLLQKFLPLLKERGITEQIIYRLTNVNPGRALTIK